MSDDLNPRNRSIELPITAVPDGPAPVGGLNPSEDHTDKSLLERADEVSAHLDTQLFPGITSVKQVISDLKTALEAARTENKKLKDYRNVFGLKELADTHLLRRCEQMAEQVDSAQATIASLREELDRVKKALTISDNLRRTLEEGRNALRVERATRAIEDLITDYELFRSLDLPLADDLLPLLQDVARRILDEKEPNR